jgi:hypothetical protein
MSQNFFGRSLLYQTRYLAQIVSQLSHEALLKWHWNLGSADSWTPFLATAILEEYFIYLIVATPYR